MGTVLTLQSKTETALQSSTADLRNAIADQPVLSLGSGEEPLKYGAELTTTWRLPKTISEAMIEAAHERRAALMSILEPAGKERAAQWLVKLGTVCAAATSGETAADKVNILASVLEDEPAGAFTKGSFKRAIEAFKFFPTGNELMGFARSEGNRIKTELGRLDLIIQTGPRDLPGERTWSKAAADAHREKLAAIKERETRDLARAIKEREASASAATVGTLKPLRIALPKIEAPKPE